MRDEPRNPAARTVAPDDSERSGAPGSDSDDSDDHADVDLVLVRRCRQST